jgi:hypothetical protein
MDRLVLRSLSWVWGLGLAAVALAQSPAPPAPPSPPAGTPAPATARGPAPIAWEQDFAAALQRAATERKPLFVAFLMDDEPANDQVVKEHYTDPQIQKLLAQFVCLVASVGEHRGTDPGCCKFHGLQCAQHQAIEKLARAKWLDSDLVCTPQHVFCDPAGKVLHRKIYLISKPQLARVLLLTLEDCGVDTRSLQVDFGKEGEGGSVHEERERVTRWLSDLASKNLEVREAALRGLGGADDPRALPAVLERCAAKQDDMTRFAISALGRKGNHRAVETLTGLLRETNAQVLTKAATALESIELPTATPALLAAIKKEKRDRVLGVLVRAAAKSQPANVQVRETCVKALKSASVQLSSSLLVALGRLEPHDTITTALIGQLGSKNQNVRGLAVWGLGNQRSAAAKKALLSAQQQEKTPEVLKLLPLALRQVQGQSVDGYDSQYWSFFTDYGL